MTDKHLKKNHELSPDDPFDAYRSIHFKRDTRTNEEKVKDSVTEAGHETRSVNQVVKLVNLSLTEKVKRLEKLKEESKRFDEELNMFNNMEKKSFEQSQPAPINAPSSTDLQLVSSDLLNLINKYGVNALTIALDKILSNIKETKTNSNYNL